MYDILLLGTIGINLSVAVMPVITLDPCSVALKTRLCPLQKASLDGLWCAINCQPLRFYRRSWILHWHSTNSPVRSQSPHTNHVTSGSRRRAMSVHKVFKSHICYSLLWYLTCIWKVNIETQYRDEQQTRQSAAATDHKDTRRPPCHHCSGWEFGTCLHLLWQRICVQAGNSYGTNFDSGKCTPCLESRLPRKQPSVWEFVWRTTHSRYWLSVRPSVQKARVYWVTLSNWFCLSSSLKTIKAHGSGIRCLVFLNENTVASGSKDTTVRIWTFQDGAIQARALVRGSSFDFAALLIFISS